MKNNFFILCGVVAISALAVSVYFSMTKGDTNEENTISSSSKNDTGSTSKKPTIVATKPVVSQKSNTDFSNFPPPSRHTAAQATGSSIWSNANSDYKVAPAQYAHLSQEPVDRAFIKIGRSEIEALESGSSFDLSIPQTGNLYEAEVSKTQYHPNGDKTLQATIQTTDGETHSVTITQGKQSTFGTLSTPDGVYVLEADITDGWIASKDDLVRLQDRSVTDEVHITPDNSDLPPS